jgi:ParB family transcriptional regulator, chromosome partitioning protein
MPNLYSHTREPVSIEIGIPAGLRVQAVSLGQIDRSDQRFQYRLHVDATRLREHMSLEGQQVPVTLWDSEGPSFVIVDGFRRVEAATALGWSTIRAIVRDDLDENLAAVLSFTENVRRQNYSPMDKANAIWIAIHKRRLSRSDVAIHFGLSERQVSRYLALLDLDEGIVKALQQGRVSMGHAALIHRFAPNDAERVIEDVASEQMSVGQLRRRLMRRRRAGRAGRYLEREGGGFRLRALQYHPTLPAVEKERILRALQQAIDIVRGASS